MANDSSFRVPDVPVVPVVPTLKASAVALLREMAAVQSSRQKKWAYSRAAETVLALSEPLEALVQRDGTLRKLPNIGPSTARILLEVLATGSSATVEQAIAGSVHGREIARGRDQRPTFLSGAQVQAALADRRLRGPAREDYRGDLQMHSTWSDGRDTIAAMAKACLARGYQFCALTDHARGLAIAGGLSMEAIHRQHAEIDKVNRRLRGRFRVLKGIEANIKADGGLDMTPDERRRLEIVVVAPHTKLRGEADQTRRMVTAVSTPGVHILGHPRGRKTGTRAGLVADWKQVFTAAAQHQVAIEIDGDPSRQDIDYLLARGALAAGCLFALDSDAHSTSQLDYTDTAIAHARLAGIPAARIVNCWDEERLLTWAEAAWNR